ncbi:hypothetical protein GCM10008171_20530 [Methylopila jiangsuensis]|uniref:Uncharacterized protein n=1 Tax=Methylopila jiangsuensis TaxID=586230 RepID=A0A9W6JIR1_9HYPH|nr:hypothetical protein [Methylopila jiangsuensis]MDR6286854.1 hypothetical protein [Methylopila jiangsuensis]GLK76799.1 hypothetical protein GCM10008171_20530 [Methylopila jiangsuensis]
MTRIVRFEEIDGDLVLRIPADIAARLKFAAGDEAALSTNDARLNVDRLTDEQKTQLAIVKRIMDEDDAVLRALAR